MTLALVKGANDHNRSMVSSGRHIQFSSWYIQKFLSTSTLHKCLSLNPRHGKSRTLKAFELITNPSVCHTVPNKNTA